MEVLEIKNLRANRGSEPIIRGINLKVRTGEMHVIMGPNGSGKSTFCHALMGNPSYKVTGGDILINGKSMLRLPTDKRAKSGLFLGFQYPVEVAGVGLGNFLRLASNNIKQASGKNSRPAGPIEFQARLAEEAEKLGVNKSFIRRGLNEGFSGGEKKRSEILQMAVLKPKFAILDEIDSGLDIDALKVVARGIERVRRNNRMGIVLITHYQRILDYLKPDRVHVMAKGRIVKSGGRALARMLEKEGYAGLS